LSAETGAYGLLLSWQASLLPFDVMTGKRIYSNMLIERLQVTTDQHSEFALMATIACRQVIIVSTATTTVEGASSSNSAHEDRRRPPDADGGTKQAGDVGTVPDKPSPTYPADQGSTRFGGGADLVRQDQLGGLTPTSLGGSTPTASAVDLQMSSDFVATPNVPEIPAIGSSDLPLIG
jgi:hypothetical protein